MIVKNNYNECLTNIACSIRKYFELDYKHNSLEYIDELLNKNNYKNVVVILYDGMGSNIIDRILDKDDFFIKNRYKKITTVFPATTTAATTSIRTGLNPIEHNYLGWNVYINKIDKTITLFMNTEKGKDEVCNEFLDIRKDITCKSIVQEINSLGKYKAMEVSPFGNIKYKDLDDMLNIIEEECNKDGKKYIYAYDMEPDHSMHEVGPDSDIVKELIKERNNKTEELCNRLKDSLVIIVADHGHIKVEHLFLKDYPDILEMLERTTSLEQRATSFKIKKGYKEKFVNKFNEYFKDFYKLYSRKEVIDSHLFGDGDESEIFKDALGDYIAISYTNKCIVNDDDDVLYSHHAGYTDDEIYIPLIIVDRK